MIRAAAEVYAREVQLRRLMTRDEVENVIGKVLGAEDVQASEVEIATIMAGTRRLVSDRTLVEKIFSRAEKSAGPIEISNEDMRRAGEILGAISERDHATRMKPMGI